MADILMQDGRDNRQAAVSADRAELSAVEPRCSAQEFRYPLRFRNRESSWDPRGRPATAHALSASESGGKGTLLLQGSEFVVAKWPQLKCCFGDCEGGSILFLNIG